MAKTIFFILFIILPSSLKAQTNFSGEISYGEKIINLPIDTALVKNDAKNFILEQMEKVKKALSGNKKIYILKFNNEESIFQPIPIMENDANPYLKRAISPGIYYTNNKKNISFHQLEAFGNIYRVKSEKGKIDWQILPQSKIIAGYLCYKATGKVRKNEDVIIEVEAWFAPQIPPSFGPKEYSGLPGLILGLVERGHYFYAMDINLKNQQLEIKAPGKGKLITQKEFENMIKGAVQNMRPNR